MCCSAKIVRLPSQAWRVLGSKLNPRNLEDAKDFTSSDLSLKILVQLMNDRHPIKNERSLLYMYVCLHVPITFFFFKCLHFSLYAIVAAVAAPLQAFLAAKALANTSQESVVLKWLNE